MSPYFNYTGKQQNIKLARKNMNRLVGFLFWKSLKAIMKEGHKLMDKFK